MYLRGDTDQLTSASFSPDGSPIVTASMDGTVRSYACALCGDLDILVAAAADTTRRDLGSAHAGATTALPAGRRRLVAHGESDQRLLVVHAHDRVSAVLAAPVKVCASATRGGCMSVTPGSTRPTKPFAGAGRAVRRRVSPSVLYPGALSKRLRKNGPLSREAMERAATANALGLPPAT